MTRLTLALAALFLLPLAIFACGGGNESPSATITPSPTITCHTPTPVSTTPGASPTTSPSPASTTAPPTSVPTITPGADAWVTVSVATLWRSPQSVRALDGPALENPARVRDWLAGMSDADRADLDGRADSQVLLGDRVHVVAVSDGWAQVVVPDQPTPLDSGGYPGWIPLAQLSAIAPSQSASTALVTAPTAWLGLSPGAHDVEVSYGTRLPVISPAGL